MVPGLGSAVVRHTRGRAPARRAGAAQARGRALRGRPSRSLGWPI